MAEGSEEVSQATVVLSLEELIKTNITNMDKGRDELKKLKQMYDDAFSNNPTYRELDERAKDAGKAKAKTRGEISKQPSVADNANKIKQLSSDLKERQAALSDYLQEYQRLTGANEIEDEQGVLRDIVKTAKLVKRSAPVRK